MILERYIFRELVGSFLFAFFAVLMVCLVGTMFQVFRTFPGLGFTILAQALPMATGAMASWVMLVATSTSSTLVYARLSAENEITAMRACGIHTWRLIAPALLFGLLLVCFTYPLVEYVVPWTRYAKRMAFRQSTIQALKFPPAGKQDFYIGSLRLTYTDYRNGLMVNPTITKMNRQTQTVIMDYYAPSGRIAADEGPLRVIMSKPNYWTIDKNGRQEHFRAGSDVAVEIPLEDYENALPQDVDQPDDILFDKIAAAKSRTVRNPLLLILHSRYATSLAPLLLVLVAVPIGILVRRGSRLAGLGAALPPLLIYFVSYFVFQGLGDKNRVHPILAAYAPDLFLATLSSILMWGVSRR
jgi:lipopolysaccharide export LptBFGC system permease protein LptF